MHAEWCSQKNIGVPFYWRIYGEKSSSERNFEELRVEVP